MNRLWLDMPPPGGVTSEAGIPCRVRGVGWERLELSTNALKGRCSTIELPTRQTRENLG